MNWENLPPESTVHRQKEPRERLSQKCPDSVWVNWEYLSPESTVHKTEGTPGETESESSSWDRELGDVGGRETLWGTWFRQTWLLCADPSQCVGGLAAHGLYVSSISSVW